MRREVETYLTGGVEGNNKSEEGGWLELKE